MNKNILIVFAAIGTFYHGNALPACTIDTEKIAYEAFESAKSWPEYHRAFNEYSCCDDGYVAAIISTKTVELMVSDLDKLISNDLYTSDKFVIFLSNHINESMLKTDLENLIKAQSLHCLSSDNPICKELQNKLHWLKNCTGDKANSVECLLN